MIINYKFAIFFLIFIILFIFFYNFYLHYKIEEITRIANLKLSSN